MIPKSESEADVRSAYCAAAITYILTYKHTDLKVGYDITKLVEYLQTCRSFTGGFGDTNNYESHSGLTYCAVSALKLLN